MTETAPDRRDLVAQATGTLVLLGGATTPRGAALGEFFRLSRAQSDGSIVALTSASGNPIRSAKHWRHDFREAGCVPPYTPIITTRDQASDPKVVDAIHNATGIFLGGGDQVKLISILGGSPVEEAIRDAYIRGAVIGGTSAGAAALSKTTFAGNEVDESGHLVEQYIGPGLGLVRAPAIVDTHFSQRRRLYRLYVALAEFPKLLGLGIDEDTALVLNGDIGRVVGAGGVTFLDGTSITFSNASQLRQGEALTLSAMRVGIVGDGYGLNLRTRELLSH